MYKYTTARLIRSPKHLSIGTLAASSTSMLNVFGDLTASTHKPFRSLSSTSSTPRPTGVRFQLLSDLHLEQPSASFPSGPSTSYTTFSSSIPHTAPYLILAGDIGKLADYSAYLGFLASLVPHYERIFLVPGNHEYYGVSIEDGLEAMWRLEREEMLRGRVSVLSRGRVDLDWDGEDGNEGGSNGERGGVTVLGCTLWSHIPEDARKRVGNGINDFNMIEDWSIDAHNGAHAADVFWLKSQLAEIAAENRVIGNETKQRRVLIVTHHVPTSSWMARSPELKSSALKTAFQTNVFGDGEMDFEGAGVRAWACGHTHWSFEIEARGVLVVSNQKSYEGQKAGFDPRKVIEV